MDANLTRHDFLVTASSGGLLYHCRQGCGRQLIVDRSSGGLTILERGDPWALHVGSSGGVELGVNVAQS